MAIFNSYVKLPEGTRRTSHFCSKNSSNPQVWDRFASALEVAMLRSYAVKAFEGWGRRFLELGMLGMGQNQWKNPRFLDVFHVFFPVELVQHSAISYLKLKCRAQWMESADPRSLIVLVFARLQRVDMQLQIQHHWGFQFMDPKLEEKAWLCSDWLSVFF